MRLPASASTLVTVGDDAPTTMASRVDPEGARRMMDILINLYADRRLAVVREYVSNAVDATRAAGSSAPVQVTSPTELEPNLIVADSGIGMTAADVEAVFLAFAASTKRDSNDLIGGLGVGAKSALTLSESFLVDTVKGGRRTLVRAARDLTHTVLLADSPSELPTGTTITVGVDVSSNPEAWTKVIAEVASAHPEGTVLVDGQSVPSLAGGSQWIGPVSCRKAGDRQVAILSGGTLFDAVSEVTHAVTEATKLRGAIIELPIGSFDHTPSRESVVATERTMAAVSAALDEFATAYAELSERVENLARTNVQAAAALRRSVLGDLSCPDLLPIPFHAEVADGTGVWKADGRTRAGTHRWQRMESGSTMFLALSAQEVLDETLVVTGVPARRTLRAFSAMVAENYPSIRRIVAIPEDTETVELPILAEGGVQTGQSWPISAETPGVTAVAFTDWQEAITARRSPRGCAIPGYQTRVIATAGAAVPAVAELSGAELAALNVDVCYVATDPQYHGDRRLGDHPVALVYLGRRKTGPLLAAVPGAQEFSTWRRAHAEAALTGFSRTELLAAAASCAGYTRKSELMSLMVDLSVLLDPVHPLAKLVSDLAEIASASESLTAQQKRIVNMAGECGALSTAVCDFHRMTEKLERSYPLLRYMRGSMTRSERADFVAYMQHTPPALPDNNNNNAESRAA